MTLDFGCRDSSTWVWYLNAIVDHTTSRVEVGIGSLVSSMGAVETWLVFAFKQPLAVLKDEYFYDFPHLRPIPLLWHIISITSNIS